MTARRTAASRHLDRNAPAAVPFGDFNDLEPGFSVSARQLEHQELRLNVAQLPTEPRVPATAPHRHGECLAVKPLHRPEDTIRSADVLTDFLGPLPALERARPNVDDFETGVWNQVDLQRETSDPIA